MGLCNSLQLPENSNNLDSNLDSYLLFESCNETTKEKIFSIMDKRIQEAITNDKYHIGFSLKTFFLPNKITEDSFYNYYDVFLNIEIKENEFKDVYVPYNIIIERLKRFINYSYSIHHTYWYKEYIQVDKKTKSLYSTFEPYQIQIIGGKKYKWFGLLHITKIHSAPTKSDTINVTIEHE